MFATSSSKAYIRKLKLKGWRSFEDCTLNFSPGINLLVGANNAGKSNLLEAINLVLGDVYLSKFVPATTDFYAGNCTDFEISFQVVMPGESTSKWPFRAQSFFIKDPDNLDNIVLLIQCSCQQGHSPLTRFWNKDQQQWEEFSTFYLMQQLDFVYVRPVRDISRHTATSYHSPLTDIRRLIDQQMNPESALEISRLIAGANKVLMGDPALVGFQEKLETAARQQTDVSKVAFSITPHTKSELLKNLTIVGQDTFESGIETKGSGTQNSIILALYQVLASSTNKSIIFGFEEPEIGFHPHGQRQLMKVFHSLAQNAQIFIATHSVNLIDQSSMQALKRITKEGAKSKYYELPADPTIWKSLDKRIAGEATELFFADRVLFVEGLSEQGFLPRVSALVTNPAKPNETLDFDRLDISVIHCQGKNDIPTYITVARSLGIPYIAVADRDKDLKLKLFIGMLKKDLITPEQLDQIPDQIEEEWVVNNRAFLQSIGCIVTEKKGFEEELLTLPTIYPKLLQAINTVRAYYGESPLDPHVLENWSIEKQHDCLFQELRARKGRRLGFEVGSTLESFSEIPSFFLSVVRVAAGANTTELDSQTTDVGDRTS